jgi:hypothetical protein
MIAAVATKRLSYLYNYIFRIVLKITIASFQFACGRIKLKISTYLLCR